MSNAFVFTAEPRALAASKTTRATPAASPSATATLRSTMSTTGAAAAGRYRDESKESLSLSLMSDPRVVRGSNFSARSAAFMKGQHAALASAASTLSSSGSGMRDQSTLPGSYSATALSSTQPALGSRKRSPSPAVRPSTPPPVDGRLHLSTQTDPLFHDLRAQPDRQQTQPTQTDAEMDADTAVLFVVRSSGQDVGTQMDAGGIADFDRDVEAVVQVLTERALEDGMREVCEEQEERQLRRWRDEWEEKMQLEVGKVKGMLEKDRRKQQERQDRIRLREERRRKLQEEEAERRQKAAQELQERKEAERVRQREEAERVDPTVLEVQQQFVPWLQQRVDAAMREQTGLQQTADGLLRLSLSAAAASTHQARQQRLQREFDAHVEARYQGRSVPAVSILTSAERQQRGRFCFMQSLQQQAARVTVELDAEAEASRRIMLREAEQQRQAKYERDVLLVQALARARRDRRRVAVLRARKTLVESRKTMTPKQVLETLGLQLGATMEEMSAEAAVKTEEEIMAEEPAAAREAVKVDGDSTAVPAASTELGLPLLEVKEDSVGSQLLSASRPATSSSPRPASSSSAQSASQAASRPMTAAATTAPPAPSLRITRVQAASPALYASLLPLDRITAVNGSPITTLASLQSVLSSAASGSRLLPGDVVTLSVWRHVSDCVQQVKLELGSDEEKEYSLEAVRAMRAEAGLKVSDIPLLDAEAAAAEIAKMGGKAGFTVAKRPGKGSEKGGVVVSKITAGSGAERAGLREGDVVLKAGREAVAGVEEWKEMSANWQAGECLQLRLLRADAGEAAGEERVLLEVGAATAPKKNTVELVRSLRRIAGLKFSAT